MRAAKSISRLILVACLSLCGQVSRISDGFKANSVNARTIREISLNASRSRATQVRKQLFKYPTAPRRVGRVTYWVVPGDRAVVASGKIVKTEAINKFSAGINLNFFNRATGKPVGVARGIGISQSDVVVTPSQNRFAIVITKLGHVRILSEKNLHRHKSNLLFWSGWYPVISFSRQGYTFRGLRHSLRGVTVNRMDALSGLDAYRKRDRLLFFVSTKNNVIIPVIVRNATLLDSLNLGCKIAQNYEPDSVVIGDSGSAIRVLDGGVEQNIPQGRVFLLTHSSSVRNVAANLR